MAKQRAAGPMKDFTNVEAVFEEMARLGFFLNERHRAEKLRELTDESFDPHRSNEHWYGNGYLELKIFKRMFGAYELCNFRGLIHPELDGLFELAEMPKIRG